MEKTKSPRQYPPMYEKVFPLALGALGLVIAALLVVTIAVAMQLVGAG